MAIRRLSARLAQQRPIPPKVTLPSSPRDPDEMELNFGDQVPSVEESEKATTVVEKATPLDSGPAHIPVAPPPVSPPIKQVPPRSGSSPETAVSISRLTSAVRFLLEDRFPDIWVIGEISNSRPASSGHYYFTLKDSGATLQAVLFRSDAQRITCPLPLKDGQSVLARGRLTLYDARGQYQLQITDLRLQGSGLLQQRFLELKQRLQDEGLFALERKRGLPIFPEQIGIVTSLQGAVLHDLCTVLARRASGIRILVRGVRVQGPEAALEIAQSIRAFSEDKSLDRRIDLLIVARGGGSLEDLWPFNEEAVARALAACSVPTVSAVGHETDFSISDFVADLRAPTPSAAAEMITRDWADWRGDVADLRVGLKAAAVRQLAHLKRTWSHLAESAVLRQPQRVLQRLALKVDDMESQLRRALVNSLSQKKARLPLLALRLHTNHPAQTLQRLRHRLALLLSRLQTQHPAITIRQHRSKLAHLAAQLRSLGPQSTLDRGYALLLDKDGHPIRQAEPNHVGQTARALVSKGEFKVKITEVKGA